MPQSNGKIVAVPTAYNVYRVDEEAIMVLSSQLVTQPPLIVLEALVMDGHAKLVKRIMMYDPTDYEDESPVEEGHDDEPDEEQLPGPWYQPDEGE